MLWKLTGLEIRSILDGVTVRFCYLPPINMVSWMSGLNRHPAKVLAQEIGSVGSNPTLTTMPR